MDDNRDFPAAGGEVHGCADVAADADQDVRAGFIEDDAGLPHGTGEPAGKPQQVHRGFPRKGHPADGGEVQPRGRDQPGLHPVGGADGEEPGLRTGLPDRVCDGQEGADVPGCSAAGEDNGQ